MELKTNILPEKLTEEEQEEVLAEVGYTRRQLDADLEHIKEWLKQQHHLPPSRLTESDSFLKMYLVGCKASLEKVKRKLDGYYTFRSHSEMFDSRDPLDPDYVQIKSITYYVSLPKLWKHTRYCFYKLADTVPEKYDFLSLLRNVLSVIELAMRYEGSFGLRSSLMFDAKGITASHVAKAKPLLAKDFLYYTMNTLPFRYSNIRVINAPQFLVTAVNTLALPFLPKKVKSRMYITANGFEEVSQYFDKSILPKDYGGDLPPMKELSDCWRVMEIERRDWFMNELSERCDESKRIVVEDPTNPYFGVPGSLKRLVVD